MAEIILIYMLSYFLHNFLNISFMKTFIFFRDPFNEFSSSAIIHAYVYVISILVDFVKFDDIGMIEFL